MAGQGLGLGVRAGPAKGLADLPEDLAAPEIAAGRLVALMGDWCPLTPGYHLCDPSRRLVAQSFATFRDAMRHRG